MTNQKLVDELEKALTDEVYDGGMGALNEEQFGELVRTLAVTADEVVEKAHTPTDDEREALATILATWRDGDPEAWAIDMYLEPADLILAAGFHRTEVPEPGVDDGHDGWCGCEKCEPSDDGHLITDCEHGVNSIYDRCAPCEAAEQWRMEHAAGVVGQEGAETDA